MAAALPAQAQAPNADEQAGRRLYLEGVTPSGEPLRALVGIGRTAISGPAVACGNCHGADGKGRPESSVTPPEITWDELTKSYGRVHGSRRRGTFDVPSFHRAVSEGIDPAGNALDWAMPRYALSASEAGALVAYLKRIAREQDPGIGGHALRIGTVLPSRGRVAPVARAVREALTAYLETINRAGGIHQRRLELVVVDDSVEAVRRFAEEPVFALLSPVESEDGGGLGALLGQSKLPMVGPHAVTRDPAALRNRLVFYLFAGHAEQAAVLVDFAARRSAASQMRAAVVASGASPHGHAGRAAGERCGKRGCADALRIGWYVKEFDAAAAVQTLKAEQRDQLFFFGSENEFARFLDEARKALDASWRPSVHAAGALMRVALAAPARLDAHMFFAFPSAPLEPSSAGAAAWKRLQGEFALGAQQQPAQLGALGAAAVLVEGLRRSGRELSRERFVRALESLSNFDPGGFAPPVTYGPDRRVGALGGYVMALDGERGVAPASPWIALD